MEKQNVLFVLKDFLRSGGVEKVTLNLANEFARQGHKVGIFIMDAGDVEEELFYNFETFFGDSGGVSGIAKYTFKLGDFIKKGKYELVISAKEQANLLNYATKIFYRGYTPVYTRHCAFDVSDQDLSVSQITNLYKLYAKGRGNIVAISDDLSKYIKKQIPKIKDKVSFCPNPVVSENLYNLASKNTEQFSHPRPYLCAVGRLCEQKGFDLLLKIYRHALDENENLPDLIIVGEGEDLKQLEALREELDLNDKVFFNGYSSNPYYIIKNSELYLLSSRHEGLPTVLIEALALKKGIVAFDCPTGPREILQDGDYGDLIPIGDLKQFAKSINNKLVSPANLSGDEISKYTFERSAKAYLALLNK